jgi:hypothetical protein
MENEIKNRENVEELIEDTKIVRKNIDHITYLLELPLSGMNFMMNIHVNPYTGELLDSDYEWNTGFIFRRAKGLLNAYEDCKLNERARQNLSNTFYELVYSYL